MLLRLTVDDYGELRDRLKLEAGTGRLRWTGCPELLPSGKKVEIRVHLRAPRENLVFTGTIAGVASEPAGVWISIPCADLVITSSEIGFARKHRRCAAEHLALIETKTGLLLCRVQDLSEGGAKLLVSCQDAGPIDSSTYVSLLEAGLHGLDLDVHARIAWADENGVGVEWLDLGEAGKSAVKRLIRAGDVPWWLSRTG
jgi:hypothetical protein